MQYMQSCSSAACSSSSAHQLMSVSCLVMHCILLQYTAYYCILCHLESHGQGVFTTIQHQ